SYHHPNKKLPTFSEEVGFGRRLRGNANGLNILGWIVLRLQNVSIANFGFVNPKQKWVHPTLCENVVDFARVGFTEPVTARIVPMQRLPGPPIRNSEANDC